MFSVDVAVFFTNPLSFHRCVQGIISSSIPFAQEEQRIDFTNMGVVIDEASLALVFLGDF
jgi:hypothetical protein|uniref:Uncharacterized protein n=2 Tax=Arabidopsis thaliana TaxID=3702 RepID=Q1G3D5_ARATH|nr:unknown protein [Arabidopsis thaliana]BAF00459.1 hypothetical protein [Arabidopsis thaliana]